MSHLAATIAVMTHSAHDVAAEIRRRLPGVGAKKLHKLLYYCQGHHLAHFDMPLFTESVSAWDMGPVVGQLWHDERLQPGPRGHADLTEAELNTIGFVISRYGALSGLDLEHLAHAEDPWLLADRDRPQGGSVRIERDWMRDYFRSIGDGHEDGEIWFEYETVVALTVGAEQRLAAAGPPGPDQTDRLRARLRELQGESPGV